MAYLGKTPSQAVRSRYYFTATGGETSLSGADDNANTLTFTDGNYVDVALNGVTLVAGTDYNTTTANTIGGLTALVASDVVEVIVYDTFSVFGGNMAANLNFKDNVKANFGTGSDLQIYHDGSNSIVNDAGTGSLKFQYGGTDGVVLDSSGNVGIGTTSPNQLLEVADSSGGATVNISTDQAAGSIASKKYMNLDFSGYLNTVMARIQSWDESSSTGNGYLTFHTTPSGGSVTERMRIDNSGNVGINTVSPARDLHINGTAASAKAFVRFTHDGLASTGLDVGYSSGGFASIYNAENTAMAFSTNATERMRITAAGGIEIPNQNAINELTFTGGDFTNIFSNTTGGIQLGTTAASYVSFLTNNTERLRVLPTGGITFNGDTSTNNALDDYEEGAWTATFAASTTTATGYYVKVGATVFFTVYGNSLNVTSTGTSAAISGLPFTNNGGYTVFNISHDTYTNNAENGYIQSGGTIMYPIQDGTVSAAGTVAGNPKYIMASGTYITDS